METSSPLSPIEQYRSFLSRAGLRLTTQRMSLLSIIFGDASAESVPFPHVHITPEQLFKRANEGIGSVSLATIYNTLNHLVAIGLMKVVHTPTGMVFDTDVTPHAHLYHVDSKALSDAASVALETLPVVMDSAYTVLDVDVVIHVCPVMSKD